MFKCFIKSWGNSLAIRIPQAILKELGLCLNDEVSLEVHDGALIIKKTASKVPEIKTLFANYEEKKTVLKWQ